MMFTVLKSGDVLNTTQIFQPGTFRAAFKLHPCLRMDIWHRRERTAEEISVSAGKGLSTRILRNTFARHDSNKRVNARPPCREQRGAHAGDIR